MRHGTSRIHALITGTAIASCLMVTMLVGGETFAAPPAPPTGSETAGPIADAGDIVVTARRHEETLQSVPLAITAISGKSLAQSGARNAQDIAFLTPGLIIDQGTGETGVSPVIRGLALLGAPNGDQVVATFFDGAFIGGSSANSIALLDLQRVEVVKGPVNSLYGRAAYSGAINYISIVPNGKFDLEATGSIGNDGQRAIKGVVGFGIIPNILAVRIAGGYDAYDGGYKDQVNNLRAGGYEKRDGQISIAFTPTSNFSMLGRVYYGHDAFGPGALAYNDPNCGGTNTYAGVSRRNYLCGKYDPKQHSVEIAPESIRFDANNRKIISSYLRTHYEADKFDVTSLTTYTKITERRFTDFNGVRNGIPYNLYPSNVNPAKPGTPLGTTDLYVNFGADANDRDVSQELRFSAKQDARLRWSFGGYYANVHLLDSTIAGLDSNDIPQGETILGAFSSYDYDRLFLTPGGVLSPGLTLATSTEALWSGFAGTDFDVTRKLTLTAEARYSADKRGIDPEYNNGFSTGTPGNYTLIYRPTGGPFSKTFKYWTGRLSAQYKFSRDFMVYVTYADGVKAGGFNQRAQGPLDLSFGNEKNKTYEAGVKANLFNRLVQANLSVFYIDLSGLQLLGPPSYSGTVSSVVKNVGGARSRGFEFDTTIRPMQGLTINGGVSFANAKFNKHTYSFSSAAECAQVGSVYCDPARIVVGPAPGVPAGFTGVDLGGLALPGQPKWTGSLQVNYERIISNDITLISNVQYRYQSRQYGTNGNPLDDFWYGPLNRVNVRLGIVYNNVTATLFADNIFSNKTPSTAYRQVMLNNFAYEFMAALPDPRRYGLTVSYKF